MKTIEQFVRVWYSKEKILGVIFVFDNIGGKIKILAQVVCWIGIACSVISGFVIMASDEDMALLGLMIMIVGSLLSWVSSFTLYGFGQLIENTDKLVLNTEKPYSNKNAKQANKVNEDTYTENVFFKDIQKEIFKKQTPTEFLTEIKETKTADLELILQDQKDLYNEEEISIIEKELSSRKQYDKRINA